MTRTHRHVIRIAALYLAPAMAMAHPGHGEHANFVAGAPHSLAGVDQLAGFIVVGILVAAGVAATRLTASGVTATEPRSPWRQPESSLDLQLNYDFNDHFAVSFDVVNITEEEQKSYYAFADAGGPDLFNFGNTFITRQLALGFRWKY